MVAMSKEIPLQRGDVAAPVQISPCVGGLVRTWADDGETQLWTMDDPMYVLGRQAHGVYARTVQEENRYRECALLTKDTGVLMVQSRFPIFSSDQADASGDTALQLEGQVIQLRPATEPTSKPLQELRWVLESAVRHCANSGEFLVVERGGWDSPHEPYALFALIQEKTGPVSVVETAPAPYGSSAWEPHIMPGQPGSTMSAPATQEVLEAAPLLILEAVSQWGLAPWDLALNFGRFPDIPS